MCGQFGGQCFQLIWWGVSLLGLVCAYLMRLGQCVISWCDGMSVCLVGVMGGQF